VRPDVAAPAEVPRLDRLKAMDVSAEAVAGKLPAASAWLRETFLW